MKTIKLNVLIIIISLAILTSCDNSKVKVEKSKTTIDSIKTTGKNSSDKVIAPNHNAEETFNLVSKSKLDDFNKEISIKKYKTEEEIMTAYSPKSDETEGNYQYNITIKNSEKTTSEVTLIETGIMDDSINGIKTMMTLTKVNNSFKVVSIKASYKCWKGRGHENWGAELCK